MSLSFIGEMPGRIEFLTSDGKQILKDLQVLIQVTGNSIIDGSVELQVLYLLKQHQKRFMELWSIATESNDNGETHPTNILDQSMQMRCEELREFQTEKEKVESFLGLCEIVEPGTIFCKNSF